MKMKRYSIIALALVLGCTLFTGCRRGNGNMETVSPTNQVTPEMPVTTPVTKPTLPPDTEPVTEPVTEETTEGATGDATENSTDDAMPGARKLLPSMR